jgi:AcrR family transcriptional regulator
MPRRVKRRAPRDPAATRLILLRTAEKLFAERGVDAPSLREISVEAGQANNSAVAYHFGSREGLIDAILERHSFPIQARYDAQLDLLERQQRVDLRALVETLVLPIVAKLDDPDGGWEFLSISAQLSVNPRLPLVARPVAQTASALRLITAMLPFSPITPELLPFRFERVVNTIYASIVSWHRMVTEGAALVSRSAFESDLVDALLNIVSLPPSPETSQALTLLPPPPPGRKK